MHLLSDLMKGKYVALKRTAGDRKECQKLVRAGSYTTPQQLTWWWLGQAHTSATSQWNRHSVVNAILTTVKVPASFCSISNRWPTRKLRYTGHPEYVPDHFQNTINSSVVRGIPISKISWKSAHNSFELSRSQAHKQPPDRQTNGGHNRTPPKAAEVMVYMVHRGCSFRNLTVKTALKFVNILLSYRQN